MTYLRYLLLFVLLPAAHASYSQVVSTISEPSGYETAFLYEVKVIEEFIERFNDDPSSYIRQQSRALLGTDSMITRRRLVRSLFDKKQKWAAYVDSFTMQVCEKEQHISFSDSTWQARAVCVFSLNGKSTDVTVTLQVERENNGLKWVVADIESPSLPKAVNQAKALKNTNDFIPTSSAATNFVYLFYVFDRNVLSTSYFSAAALHNPAVGNFAALITGGQAKFVKVSGVTYRFAQIPGWVMTVEQRKRKETNSGWLISKLERTTPH